MTGRGWSETAGRRADPAGPEGDSLPYLPTVDLISRRGGLIEAVSAVLSWRTQAWSDRTVAATILLVQRSWPRRSGQQQVYASVREIAQALGYKDRTPLVQRALARLLRGGWLRTVGPTGPGRRRVFEFWAGEGRPPAVPSPAPAKAACIGAVRPSPAEYLAAFARRAPEYERAIAEAMARARRCPAPGRPWFARRGRPLGTLRHAGPR